MAIPTIADKQFGQGHTLPRRAQPCPVQPFDSALLCRAGALHQACPYYEANIMRVVNNFQTNSPVVGQCALPLALVRRQTHLIEETQEYVSNVKG